MNDKTTALLHDVVTRLEKSIIARDCPAVVVLDGDRRLALSDYDYLRDEATATAFETRAASKARDIGAIKIEKAGRHTLTVKPHSKPGAAVMDLRLVTLKPEK